MSRSLPFLLLISLLSCGKVVAPPDGGGADGDLADAESDRDGDESTDVEVWCTTQWPHETATRVDTPTELLFLRLRVEGVTPTDGAEPRLTAELGFGPASAAPWEPGWVWNRTEHNPRCDDCPEDQDERMGTVTPTLEGDLRWAGRVRFDGSSWVYCDRADEGRSGSDDGWSADDAPLLSVEAAARLGVVSLNLRCLLDDWDLRLPLIAEALAAADPDVIGFQEVCAEPGGGRDNLLELLAALEDRTGRSYSAVRTVTHLSWDIYDEGLAIVSPHAIEEERVIDLPAGAFPRKAVIGRVSSAVGAVVMITTHLDHRSNDARALQVAALVDGFDTLPEADALVLTGDFNEGPGGGVHDALTGVGLTDVWALLRPGEAGYTFPADDPEIRIDYIWLDPGTALLAPSAIVRILGDSAGGVTGSDHLGLAAIIGLP